MNNLGGNPLTTSKRNFFIALLMIAAIVCLAIFGCGPLKGAGQIRFGIDIRGGVEAIFVPQNLERAPSLAELEQARTILETRLDTKGILDREVTIDKEGGGVIVRFPWKSDETDFNPESAISELGQMAQLTFRDEQGNVLLQGKNVKSARVVNNQQTNRPVIALEFDAEGAQLFADATAKLVGKRMAIYMDETLLSAPTVNSRIEGGSAVIENMESFEAASDLAVKINSGALPFSLETRNFSSISPSLGSGALSIMMLAGGIAFILICAFMILKYRLPGVISAIALLLQLAGQLLFISLPQITLTLPGIAGVILSLGMGVDANVIISERISEELRAGATLRTAVKNGYKNAFSSVFDGNITTAIVAVILMIFGSGTMFSFGYTLLCGIILNFAAGVFSTKVMMNSIIQFRPMQNKWLYQAGKEKKVRQFYQKRYVAYTLSLVVIAVGIIYSFVGGVSLDTQFTGGAVLKYTFVGELDADEAERIADEVLHRPATAQIATDLGGTGQRLSLTLAGEAGITPDEQQMLNERLSEEFAGSELALSESFMVEPYIGERSLRNSVIAIVLSFLLIMVYVWIRFRKISGLSAGVMALVALMHDVFIVFCTFVLFRIPLNDSFVAVVLTIIGFSINDTIVIYDRIRENRELFPKLSVIELVNKSISQSFTRSLNTTITTIISSILMCVFAILYGIESIRMFALPMTFGLVCGCYSTICIAGPLWVSWQLFKAKKKKSPYGHKEKIAG